jgi:hypothetical protein
MALYTQTTTLANEVWGEPLETSGLWQSYV